MTSEHDIVRIGRLSTSSLLVLANANFEARRRNQETGLEYLLLGITSVKTVLAEEVLKKLGITKNKVCEVINEMDGQLLLNVKGRGMVSTPEFVQTFDLARVHAEEQHRETEPEDLLLASTKVPMTERFGNLLYNMNVAYPTYRDIIQDAFRE
jgi:ATP-dependent Clp protease ATP-binding subunit ClpA